MDGNKGTSMVYTLMNERLPAMRTRALSHTPAKIQGKNKPRQHVI